MTTCPDHRDDGVAASDAERSDLEKDAEKVAIMPPLLALLPSVFRTPQAQEADTARMAAMLAERRAGEERARNQRVQQGGLSAQDHLPCHDYVHNEGRRLPAFPEDRFHGGIELKASYQTVMMERRPAAG
ncbi:MAG: hypothetical protein ACLT8E_07010 [Akkermansia sp.]